MRVLVTMAACAILSGCSGMAGVGDTMTATFNVPSQGVSELDGSKHIRMSNILCGNRVVLELYQSTESARAEQVLMSAGVNSIDSIGRGESLHIRADSEIWAFTPVSPVTARGVIDYGGAHSVPTSTKSYLVPEGRVRKMASAEELIVRVELLDNTYAEAACHSMPGYDELTDEMRRVSESIAPMTGIKEFVEMMDAASW